MNKQDRKRKNRTMVRAWQSDQRAKARARLPLPSGVLREMFDMLSATIFTEGCDHSLRLVERWAVARGFDFPAIEDWLNETGGFCDCEALANSEEAWLDAVRDSDPNHRPD